VTGLGIKARRRLVAQLVHEWTGAALTADTVRLDVARWRRQFDRVRPACTRNPVTPLYITTHTALLTALLGAAPPVRAPEACRSPCGDTRLTPSTSLRWPRLSVALPRSPALWPRRFAPCWSHGSTPSAWRCSASEARPRGVHLAR